MPGLFPDPYGLVRYLRQFNTNNFSDVNVCDRILAVCPRGENPSLGSGEFFYFEVSCGEGDWRLKVDDVTFECVGGSVWVNGVLSEAFFNVADAHHKRGYSLGFFCNRPEKFIRVLHSCGLCDYAAQTVISIMCEITDGRLELTGMSISDEVECYSPFFSAELEWLRSDESWVLPAFTKYSKSCWVPSGLRLTGSDYRARLYVEFDIRCQCDVMLGMGASEVRIQLAAPRTVRVTSASGTRIYSMYMPGRIGLFSSAGLGEFMVFCVSGDPRLLAKEKLLDPASDTVCFQYSDDSPTHIAAVNPRVDAVISPYHAAEPPELRCHEWGQMINVFINTAKEHVVNGIVSEDVGDNGEPMGYQVNAAGERVSLSLLTFDDTDDGWSVQVDRQPDGLVRAVHRPKGERKLVLEFGGSNQALVPLFFDPRSESPMPKKFGVAIVHGPQCRNPGLQLFNATSFHGRILCRVPSVMRTVKAAFPPGTRRLRADEFVGFTEEDEEDDL